jgi:hypothetical protein
MIKQLALLLLIGSITIAVHAQRNSIKPFGLRQVFDKGLGDRYYTGIPASHYQSFWPKWKREIWYTMGDWYNEDAPHWVAYYDYPYVVWPNSYRYFGSPYYTRSLEQKHNKKAPRKISSPLYSAANTTGLF